MTAAAWTNCADGGGAPLQARPNGNICISFDEATEPTQVRVEMPPRTIDTGLGQLAGIDTITVAAAARAVVKAGRPVRAACASSTTIDAGNADFTVSPRRDHGQRQRECGPQTRRGRRAPRSAVVGTVNGGQFAPAYTQTVADPRPAGGDRDAAIPAGNKGTNSPCGNGPNAGPGKYGSLDLRTARAPSSPARTS